jgi:DMSO reductase family type II enzyme chaperone
MRVDDSPTIETEPSHGGDAIHAAVRSHVYLLLAEPFRFPSAELHGSILDGTYATDIRRAALRLPYAFSVPDDSLVAATDYVDLQAEYIRLFDVGAKGRPPCSLYEGEHHGGARMRVMEELVRFYEHFGLELSKRELPDHLSVELEFLHFLTFKEAAALEHGGDPGPYRRAETDFLVRHPARWLPAANAKAVAERASPPFGALLALTDGFLRAEVAHLRRVADPRPLDS